MKRSTLLLFGCLVLARFGAARIEKAAGAERADSQPARAEAREPSAIGADERVRTGQTSYNWDWLASRYDGDGDGDVDRQELPASAKVFTLLDRNWDGVLTASDFQWDVKSALTDQKETTFALFKSVDASSEGRITLEEWQAAFAKAAGEKGYLNGAELEQFIFRPRIVKRQREEENRAGIDRFFSEHAALVDEAPRPGEMAPDFELRSPDGSVTVRLSALRGEKPVVLVFGNFTCGNFRTYVDPVSEIYRRWKDRAHFVTVYVREAHPVGDQPATSTNARAGLLVKQPTTLDERCDIAERCVATLKIEIPLVVDEIDNRAGRAYAAFPDRLYVVDSAGRVAFQGGPGPFAFNPAEMEQALILLLLEQGNAEPAAEPTSASRP